IALQFPGSKQPPEIKGEMTFRSVDYLIKLAIAGTVKKPRFQIFSVPPRTENELISNVICGGTFEELDEGQMRSVEETRAALADGAISIMSMYYLAATPIESVGFNPHTGVFRAKIKLGRDLSLTVGSDMHQTQTVGLRKRLSPNWSVET